MSALLPGDHSEWWAQPNSGRCFYCHDGVQPSEVAVLWSGESNIVLHPSCAERLGMNLIMDSREAMLASGAHPWRLRAVKALRCSLILQETRP